LPAQASVKTLGVAARDGIENQERLAGFARRGFGRHDERRAQATATRTAMHLHLGHIGSVRLILGHGQDDLHGANDAAGIQLLGDEHDALAACGAREGALPERDGFFAG